MVYVFYIIVYWIICDIIGLSIQLFNKTNKTIRIKEVLIMIAVAPLIPFFLLLLPIIYISERKDKKKKEQDRKEKDRKEQELKEKLGLKPDEEYVSFQKMGGAGIIKCKECGYKEEIISFIHGISECHIGRQCPHCLSFVSEYNRSQEYHTFGKSEIDFVCPKCGKVIRKKDESILIRNDEPLLCPKCHSYRLIYFMSYIT